jgi:hypothetical protein
MADIAVRRCDRRLRRTSMAVEAVADPTAAAGVGDHIDAERESSFFPKPGSKVSWAGLLFAST